MKTLSFSAKSKGISVAAVSPRSAGINAFNSILLGMALFAWEATPRIAFAEEVASPTMEAAKRHFDSGVSFYQAGDYEAARIELEAGYRLSKLPDFLVNLCFVAEKQNRVQEALNYCDQYLRLEPNASDAGEIRARAERLRQQFAQAAPPANTSKPAERPPVPAVPNTDASRQERSSLSSSTGGRQHAPVGAIALLVGGAGLLCAGVGTGAGALLTAKEIERGPAFDDLTGLERRGTALNAAAITFYVVGGVAAVAGGAWLGSWARRNAEERRAHRSVAVILLPTVMVDP